MAKTITLRLDDDTYGFFKSAAGNDRRTISNYIEFAALEYTLDNNFVDDAEMDWIMTHEKELEKGWRDIQKGRYRVIG